MTGRGRRGEGKRKTVDEWSVTNRHLINTSVTLVRLLRLLSSSTYTCFDFRYRFLPHGYRIFSTGVFASNRVSLLRFHSESKRSRLTSSRHLRSLKLGRVFPAVHASLGYITSRLELEFYPFNNRNIDNPLIDEPENYLCELGDNSIEHHKEPKSTYSASAVCLFLTPRPRRRKKNREKNMMIEFGYRIA